MTHNRLARARCGPVPRSTSGYVIEIDKTRQVLIVANGGHAEWVFNASTGSDHPYTLDGVGYSAHTPEGHLQRDPRRSTASTRARSASCTGRSTSPTPASRCTATPTCRRIPASHGCVRVSNAAIDFIWANNILPIGATVWVYV